jgi:hypothetical protein
MADTRMNWNRFKDKTYRVTRSSKPGWAMDGSWHEMDKPLSTASCALCWKSVKWIPDGEISPDSCEISFHAECCGIYYIADGSLNWYITTNPEEIIMDDTTFPIPE